MSLQAEPKGRVLIVDDNLEFQTVAADFASLANCRATAATTLLEARRLTRSERFDLIVVDINLPDGIGFDLLDDLDLAAHGQVAIVTGQPSMESAMRAVRSPVVEYLLKPIKAEALTALFERACLRARLHQPHRPVLCGMVGQGPVMLDLFDRIRRVAPLDVSILIHGETGTGKELVARAVHDLSERSGRFVSVNCGAITGDLLGSQLFGHERGSFTGALQSHAGYFEQAEGGTLFLDEITEMPPAQQVYLLRVLESHVLTRVGGNREIPINVRVVAATNRDPPEALAHNALRADLFYRLIEFPLAVPALDQRREDTPLLAQHFLERLNERYQTQKRFSTQALHEFMVRAWPGNVRELRHTVQRLYILANDNVIGPPPAPPQRLVDSNDGAVQFRVGMTFEDVEREMLLKTLAHHSNNKRQAARALGITAKTVYNRLLKYRELGLIDAAQLGAPEVGGSGD